VVENEGMFKVAGVVQRLGFGENGFHEIFVVAEDLKQQ
jgi:hypothetical protein